MSKQPMINTYAKESGRIWATHLDPRLGTWCYCTAPSPHWTRSLQKYTHAITTSPRTQPNSSNAQAEPVNQKPELTWDSGDDLPHLQPICEDEPKHTSGIRIGEPSPQIRGGPAEIRGGKGDETGGERLTEYGGLAGIVEAEDEDACLAVAEERREEPREHDAHGDARGLAPAAALGIRSSGLGAGRDLGFGGRGGGGRSGGRWEGVSWRARVPKTRNGDSAAGRRGKVDGGGSVLFFFNSFVWFW
jgi:hypothetical protein